MGSSLFDIYSEQTWKTITIANVSMSSISLITSTTMAVLVSRPKNGGLKTPYRRIIFGISLSDIFLSLAFVTGPWAVPPSPDNPDSFGMGNDFTCNLNGALTTMGYPAMQYYVCFLCFYFLCKLKGRMSDDNFTQKYEYKAHTLIFLFVSICSISGVYWKVFNPNTFYIMCNVATKPWGCRFFDDPDIGECEEPLTSYVDILTAVVIYFTFIFNGIGISVIMFRLTCHAKESTKNIMMNDVRTTEEDSTNHAHNQNKILYEVAISFRRQILTQAALYVGVYTLTTVPSIFFSIMIITMGSNNETPTSGVIVAISVILSSSAGIFNILVYTRPKVSLLRRKTGLSRLRALWLVLKAGGELPRKDPDPEDEEPKEESHSDDLVVHPARSPKSKEQLDGSSGLVQADDNMQGKNIDDQSDQNLSYGSLSHLNEANLHDFGLSLSNNEYVNEEEGQHEQSLGGRGEVFNENIGLSEESTNIRRKGTALPWKNLVQKSVFKSSVGGVSST